MVLQRKYALMIIASLFLGMAIGQILFYLFNNINPIGIIIGGIAGFMICGIIIIVMDKKGNN